MSRFGLAAAALLATIAGPAFAADMPLKAPPPPVAPVATWNGFYTGVEAGVVWNHSDWDPTCINNGTGDTCGSAAALLNFPGAPDSNAQFRGSTARFGIYSGWMFQAYDRWVFGAESDFGFHSKSQSVGAIIGCATLACTAGAGGFVVPPFSGDSTTLKLKDDYAFRVRAGFLVLPDLQLYVAGGPAMQKVEATLVCSATGATGACAGPTPFTSFSEKWLVGYTVGGGIEWKLMDHILLRGEYRYNDYGTWKQNANFFPAPLAEFANVHVKTQQFNVGIAWLFPPPRW